MGGQGQGWYGQGEHVVEKRILIWLAAFFYYTGIIRLAYWRKRRQGPYLTILNYHQAAEGGELRDHLRYLRRHYRVMHLDDALERSLLHFASQPILKFLRFGIQ